jgi:cell division protein FtsL
LKTRRKRKKTELKRLFMLLWGALSFLLIVLYLHGKVQADFTLREISKLEQTRDLLQQEVNDLRGQIDNLKRYDRIVRLAREQGLVSAAGFMELPVDLEGMEWPGPERAPRTHYAGLWDLPEKSGE